MLLLKKKEPAQEGGGRVLGVRDEDKKT